MLQSPHLEPLRAADLLRDSAVRHGIRLSVLVAETGLWAHPEVHRRLGAEGGNAAWFPHRRRYRAGQGESRGQTVAGLELDDNSYANIAIKRALGVAPHQVIGFETCHIWPLTCYDARYHTLIANLVLLPRALAGLTDHDPNVQAVLQYRAFELYGWYPTESPQPLKPADYPTEWRETYPLSQAVIVALARRTLKRSRPAEGESSGEKGDALGQSRRDYTRYDVAVGERVLSRLPKRVAMLVVVKALVESGVRPEDISAAVPGIGSRLFRSADGHPLSGTFVETITTKLAAIGKRFDPARYFCAEDELIRRDGRTYALLNQWGTGTQDVLNELLLRFPQAGVSVTSSSRATDGGATEASDD